MPDLPGPPPRPGPPPIPPPSPGSAWGGPPTPQQPGWGAGNSPPPPPQGFGPRRQGRLRPIGEFLSASFGLISKSVMPLLPLLIAVAVPVVLSFIAADSALGLTEWLDEVTQRATEVQPGEEFVFPVLDASESEVVTWALIVVIINIVGTAVVMLAGLVAMWAVHQGQTPGTSEILALCARALVPMLGLVLGVLALVALAMAAVVLASVLFFPVIILAVIGWIPLAFWLTARFALAVPIAAIEHRGFSAMRRSYQLTAGDGWGVLGRVLLFSVILGIGVQIASVPLSFLSVLGSAALVIGTVLSFIVSLAGSAVAQAGPLVLYADLELEAESTPMQTGWGQPI